jgi:hypothetical protein
MILRYSLWRLSAWLELRGFPFLGGALPRIK